MLSNMQKTHIQKQKKTCILHSDKGTHYNDTICGNSSLYVQNGSQCEILYKINKLNFESYEII